MILMELMCIPGRISSPHSAPSVLAKDGIRVIAGMRRDAKEYAIPRKAEGEQLARSPRYHYIEYLILQNESIFMIGAAV